jgi:hypothetical protein
MKNNQLTLRFGGDGFIKVDTLTEFLEIYKELIYLINQQLGYNDDDLIVEVSPPENGSFKIKLSPKYEKILLRSFETIVVSTLSGLLLYYLTNPTNSNTLEEIKILLEKQKINQPDVIKNVYNIYQNTNAEKKIKQSFIIVNNDNNVTDLKIEKDNFEIINVSKNDFSKLINRKEVINVIEESITDVLIDEAQLVVKTIHFEGNAKWVFVFRGYPIKALIKDPEFIKKLNNEAFRKGDTLKVLLARSRTYDEDLQTYIIDQNSYVIEKVIDHISKIDNQKKLNL